MSVTVCDQHGVIVEMNDRAAQVFAADGGRTLIGRNLMDCHNAHSQEILRDLLVGARSNTYTIEKNGVKKLIHQTPWYEGTEFRGLVELSIEIPSEMPHFIRS